MIAFFRNTYLCTVVTAMIVGPNYHVWKKRPTSGSDILHNVVVGCGEGFIVGACSPLLVIAAPAIALNHLRK
jgi:hypothetical protein